MTGKQAWVNTRKAGEDILKDFLCRISPEERAQLEVSGVDFGFLFDRLLELLQSRLKGEEGDPEVLVGMVEEFSRRDPQAWERVEDYCRRAAEWLRRERMENGSEEGKVDVEKIQTEIMLLLCRACLRGRERRHRELLEKWREIEKFPDTLAAAVDPLTLAKAGLDRLKSLLRLGSVALYELDFRKRLILVAGDDGPDPGRPLELRGEAASILLEDKKPLSLATLVDHQGGGLRQPWGDHAFLLPLVVRGRTTGALLLRTAEAGAGEDFLDMETAERFAVRLAEAMENARLHAREQKKIRETVALLEIARVVNSTLDLDQILNRVVRMTVDVCPVVLCIVYIEDRGVYKPRAWYGFIEECVREMKEERGFSRAELGTEVAEALKRGEAATLAAKEASWLLPAELLSEHGVEEVVLYPLRTRGKLAGLFALFRTGRMDDQAAWEERQFAEAIAAQASLAVENASLYADIERGYFSTVQALAKAIEVKDPYTRGHSERVTTYALMIAEALGLDEREKQKLKYAATLHDIGKIGIAGRVLNKPGALTEEEYTHVKTHPLLGDSIVEPVEFLQEPRPIILHHHERYDGKGYPDGLKGEDIPLSARILAVADAFEAMRSDRPYRRALPLEEAREELIRNAGTQFDPRVVEVFLDILEKHGGDPIPR